MVRLKYLPRWAIFTDCPPYCDEATEAIICVVMVQAVWKDLGLSIILAILDAAMARDAGRAREAMEHHMQEMAAELSGSMPGDP